MKNIISMLFIITLAANQVLAQVIHTDSDLVVASPSTSRVLVEEKPRPVVLPHNNEKQVVVVSIELEFNEGKVQAAKVLESKKIKSFAPKVFARQAGDWEVIINGREKRMFYVNNPGWREAEPHESSHNRYNWVAYTGKLIWPLVVPLYNYEKGHSLEAHSITVRDISSGRVILEVDI